MPSHYAKQILCVHNAKYLTNRYQPRLKGGTWPLSLVPCALCLRVVPCELCLGLLESQPFQTRDWRMKCNTNLDLQGQ